MIKNIKESNNLGHKITKYKCPDCNIKLYWHPNLASKNTLICSKCNKEFKMNDLNESKEEKKIRSLIKEIINNQKSYNPYSGGVINNTCEICGLPENACEHTKESFVNKKDDNKIAKVSNMQQLKEMIDVEVRKLLKENKFSKYNLNINDDIEWTVKFNEESIRFIGKVKIIGDNHLVVKDRQGNQHTITNPKIVKLKKINEIKKNNQTLENLLRDLFYRKQYNGKVPDNIIQHILKSKQWNRIGDVKKVWSDFVKEKYITKKGNDWYWENF